MDKTAPVLSGMEIPVKDTNKLSRQGAMTGVTTVLSIGPGGRLYKRIPAQMPWGQGKEAGSEAHI